MGPPFSVPAAAGIAAGAILLLIVALASVPRRLMARAQDRRAADRIRREPDVRLLTRAELVEEGRWRRIPGLLALAGEAIDFEGLFDETWALATSRISKIVTGRKMASGRLLFRHEVLRITAADGSETEFVMTPASAGAWRSHLGLWAMSERLRDAANADRVVPGRDLA
jgi:hypothetical protein